MTKGIARAEANFAAAKELCRIGHPNGTGNSCTYGGTSPSNGYWLADENCEFDHGEICDLRAQCSGAPTEARFIGHEPDPKILYWIYQVTACGPCAQTWQQEHPEYVGKGGT